MMMMRGASTARSVIANVSSVTMMMMMMKKMGARRRLSTTASAGMSAQTHYARLERICGRQDGNGNGNGNGNGRESSLWSATSVVMVPLLRACAEEGRSTLALKAWTKARKAGWTPQRGDLAMLIECVASEKDEQREEHVTKKLDDLRKMLIRSVEAGTLAERGSQSLWMDLLSACARLSSRYDTFKVALQACVDAQLTLSEFTQVLEEFRECSGTRYTASLFEHARALGLKPDARVYLTLMKGFASEPKERYVVFDLLATMMKEGTLPNKYVLTLVLRTIVTSRQFHRTAPILDMIDANPIECDLPLLNQMMACASHAPNAKPLVERILGAMKLRKIKPDVESYNMRMMLHARLKEIDHVFQLYSQMGKHDIVANDATFTVLFTACKAAGDVERAWNLFQEMDRRGCALDNRVHHSILESLFTTRGFSVPHLADVELRWRARVKEWKLAHPDSITESPIPYEKRRTRGPTVTESRKKFQRKQQQQHASKTSHTKD